MEFRGLWSRSRSRRVLKHEVLTAGATIEAPWTGAYKERDSETLKCSATRRDETIRVRRLRRYPYTIAFRPIRGVRNDSRTVSQSKHASRCALLLRAPRRHFPSARSR